MAIKYKAFTDPAEKAKLLVEFLENQERDHHIHLLNKARYEKILLGQISDEWRARISSLLAETESRIEEVESIIVATEGQLPPPEEITAAMETIRAERAARK